MTENEKSLHDKCQTLSRQIVIATTQLEGLQNLCEHPGVNRFTDMCPICFIAPIVCDHPGISRHTQDCPRCGAKSFNRLALELVEVEQTRRKFSEPDVQPS